MAADQQHRHDSLRRESAEIGRDHHQATGEPVSADAAEKEEGGEHDGLDGEGDADLSHRAADREHGEGQHRQHHQVAHRGGELGEHEPAQVSFAEHQEVEGTPGSLGHPPSFLLLDKAEQKAKLHRGLWINGVM